MEDMDSEGVTQLELVAIHHDYYQWYLPVCLVTQTPQLISSLLYTWMMVLGVQKKLVKSQSAHIREIHTHPAARTVLKTPSEVV